MRIVEVMAGDEEGGLEKHLVELSNGLAEAGEQVTVIAHGKYRDRFLPEIDFKALDLTRSRRNPWALWQLLRSIRAGHPDIVHAQGGKATSMIALLARWLPVQRVATMHGQKRKQAGINRYHAIITVSQGLARRIDHPHVKTVYNGVARQEISSDQPVCDGWIEEPRWLAVGRLVEEKGFDLLIDAFTNVPGSLLIAGDGYQQPHLEAQIVRLGLQRRVRLLGHRNDVDQLMRQADAVVIASRREGFSYVFAEALLNGAPVYATDVPIANEVLPPTLICPTGDPTALATLMQRFDPALPEHREAAAFARQNLTIDAMVSQTRTLFEALMESDER